MGWAEMGWEAMAEVLVAAGAELKDFDLLENSKFVPYLDVSSD